MSNSNTASHDNRTIDKAAHVLKLEDKMGVIKAVTKTLSLLPSHYKRSYFMLLGCNVAVSVFESVVMLAVAFFAAAILAPDGIRQNSIYLFLARLWPALNDMPFHTIALLLGFSVTFLILLKNTLRGLIQYLYMRRVAFITAYLGDLMLNTLLGMPYQWHMGKNSKNLMANIHFAINTGGFLNTVMTVASESVLSLLLTSMLAVSDPQMFLIAIAVLGIPALILLRWSKTRLDKYATMGKDHFRGTVHAALTALQGIKEVKIYGKEPFFFDRFSHHSHMRPLLQAKQDTLANIPSWGLESLGFLMLVLTMAVMFFLTNGKGEGITESLTLLTVFAWRGLPAIVRTVNGINKFRATLPMARETLMGVDELKQRSTPSVTRKDPVAPIRLNDSVNLNDIGFSYDGTDTRVLNNISFSIRKGEAIGIIGTSGAGKSTLMNLLIGLLLPTEGTIQVGDTVLTRDNVRNWTLSTGYIPQDPHIIDASIAENIAFGVKPEDIDMERVYKASKQAAVEEFIHKQPDGYDTVIGERGVRLSGGQQQRLCIARALYREPDVLLFDEATSSLDSRSERKIQTTIENLKGCVTLIVVAHRLSTIENCDKLIWLDGGTIRKVASPETLLREYKDYLSGHASPDSSDQ